VSEELRQINIRSGICKWSVCVLHSWLFVKQTLKRVLVLMLSKMLEERGLNTAYVT